MPNADLRSRRPAGTLRAFAAGGMALLAACSTSPTEKNTDGPPIPVEPPILVLSVDPTTDGQVGVVGARLPMALLGVMMKAMMPNGTPPPRFGQYRRLRIG